MKKSIMVAALVVLNMAAAEAKTLSCSVEVLSTEFCGTGDVKFKVLNFDKPTGKQRFEINYGDTACWGRNAILSGTLLNLERTFLDHRETKVFEMTVDMRREFKLKKPVVFGKMKFDPIKSIAKIEIVTDQNFKGVGRGKEYHLPCTEIDGGEK